MTLFEQTLTAAINRALALDPELPAKLAAFSGKVIVLHFTGVDKKLFLLPDNNTIRVATDYEGAIDVCMSGTPLSMIKMLMRPNVAAMLLKGEVEISGDTRLGNRFKALLRDMDINWQQPLSQYIGDAATQSLETGINRFQQWRRKSLSSFGLSLSEYVQEESRDVVTGAELEIFNRQVDTLRDDVMRFEARLEQYLQNRERKC